MEENKKAAEKSDKMAKRARKDFEEITGQKVVTGENFLPAQKKAKGFRVSKNNNRTGALHNLNIKSLTL